MPRASAATEPEGTHDSIIIQTLPRWFSASGFCLTSFPSPKLFL